mmetsp:Transcript_194/g.283  ORF Transcript_194/g.283 Transcript_194/m.283 type:complete len:141 (-) Transcript_194:83-505(-)
MATARVSFGPVEVEFIDVSGDVSEEAEPEEDETLLLSPTKRMRLSLDQSGSTPRTRLASAPAGVWKPQAGPTSLEKSEEEEDDVEVLFKTFDRADARRSSRSVIGWNMQLKVNLNKSLSKSMIGQRRRLHERDEEGTPIV